MARRVILAALAALSAIPGVAAAEVAVRAGLSHAVLGRWEQALDRLGEAPADRAGRYFRAVALLELGETAEGLAALRGLIDPGGPFAGAALERAVGLLFRRGQYGAVTEWYEAARAERFQDGDALRYRVGQSYLATRRGEQARPLLEAVGPGPYRAYARYSLGGLAFEEGRLRDAVDLLGQAVEAAASHPDPRVAAALGDRARVTRARMVYQSASTAEALPGGARQQLFRAAADQFARVKPDSAWYAEALRGVGWCQAELGDGARALAAFESAAAVDPSARHEDLWAQGRVLQRLGHLDEAARTYGLAREAALGAARDAAEGGGRGTDDLRWDDLAQAAASVGARVAGLAEVEALVAGGIAAGRERVGAATRRLDAVGERARVLGGELASMANHLGEYLDGIPAAALYGAADRGRVEALGLRQRRLGLEIERLHGVFAALEAGALWGEAPPADRARAEALWGRLAAARARLSGEQLALLQTLKERVWVREAELVRAIEAGQGEVAGLAGTVAGARGAVAAADAEWTALAARLASLEARRRALHARLATLAEGLRGAAAEEAARAAEERAARLRLRADAFALDETQALHLWQQGRGGRP
ncbi:MAG: hypothetical protein ACYDA8_16740 [Deferrisomatales bacterium]